MADIFINNKLEVIAQNKLIVPGCEPTSAITSTSLHENRECKATVVDLGDALEAIPGSTIEFMTSFGGIRRLLFVLPEGPSTRTGCVDTSSIDDYYAILRSIGRTETLPKTITEVGSGSNDLGIQTHDLCEVFSIKRPPC